MEKNIWRIMLTLYYEREGGYKALKDAQADMEKIKNVKPKTVQVDSIEILPSLEVKDANCNIYKIQGLLSIEDNKDMIDEYINDAFQNSDAKVMACNLLEN